MSWIRQFDLLPKWSKYSQAHEETYIVHILDNIKPAGNIILELGAWDGYHLSNTRYLIEQGYHALLIDGDNHGNQEVKQHFITRENILATLEKYNLPPVFDLFCIDLDGNDIYILDAVLSEYRPHVIVAEFNPIFPVGVSKAIQYNPSHTWNDDDYYGFSFSAGIKMAEKNGYSCVFQNDNLNMYFIKNDVLMESFHVEQEGLKDILPKVNYNVTQYHPHNDKGVWVDY